MLSDWELWAIANRLIVDQGPDAAIEAALRADEMLERNDLNGQRTWICVLDRIKELQAEPQGMLN
jgi:hypothetical protein